MIRLVRALVRAWANPDPAAIPSIFFLVMLLVIGALGSPNFSTPGNIANVLTNVTPLLLVATGQTFVIACRGLDLSVGSTATLVATLVATGYPVIGWPALMLAFGAALGVGLFNGAAVRYGLNPFLVTLASLSIVQGLVFTYRTSPGGKVPDELAAIAGLVGPVPVALPIVVAVAALAAIVLRWRAIGAAILATGGDPAVARLAGIRVGRSQLVAFALSAAAAGLAGIFLAARTRTGDPLIGQPLTLDSIAAVVLGGSLLAGGRVTLLGTVVGSFCLGFLPNVLNLTGVPYFYQQLVKGVLLIGAVLLPVLVGHVREYRERRDQAVRVPG
jgi:ribose transport system permease protein